MPAYTRTEVVLDRTLFFRNLQEKVYFLITWEDGHSAPNFNFVGDVVPVLFVYVKLETMLSDLYHQLQLID